MALSGARAPRPKSAAMPPPAVPSDAGCDCLDRSDHKELMEDPGDQQAGYSQSTCAAVWTWEGARVCVSLRALLEIPRGPRAGVGSQASALYLPSSKVGGRKFRAAGGGERGSTGLSSLRDPVSLSPGHPGPPAPSPV